MLMPFVTPPVYAAQGVLFDGTNDFIRKATDLSGNADGKLWTASFWFKRGATGGNQYIYTGTNSAAVRTHIIFNGSNQIEIRGDSTAPATVLSIHSSAITDTASWHHCAFSIDLANSSNRHLYIDGVSDLTVTTYTNTNIEFTTTEHTLGADGSDTSKLNANLADFWMNNTYLDLSVAANRAKFRTSAGKPEYVGDSGALVTGTAPLIFCSKISRNSAADFASNKGTGGGFTITGTLTASATNPG